ncbi:MAG: DNA polymerase Y family protein [Spirochaetales bacterium]|nr:DNA polymerase Y family protein [Spirochaetales bacterium]
MVRLACVDVADLPLQMLFRKHPEWRRGCAAVVSRDSPYGMILTANARAREYGITAGLRYAGALSLNNELRADTVADSLIREGTDCLARELGKLSPRVEAWDCEPGVFWLDGAGMSSLFPDPAHWGRTIRSSLAEIGFSAAMAAGYTRFGCYAAAKSTGEQMIFPNPRSERRRALAADIRILNLPPEVLERLEMLGIRRVGAFVELPAGAVGRRFGPQAEWMHRFASGGWEIPLQPAAAQSEPQLVLTLPDAEPSGRRLLVYLRRGIDAVTAELRGRHRLVRELRIRFVLDLPGLETEELPLEPILPASPCSDPGLLADLAALRLENLRLPGAVAAIRLSAFTVSERTIQSELFDAGLLGTGLDRGSSKQGRQNLQEVDKVFSRLRGIHGNGCIQHARLEDEHFPELSYSWEDLLSLPRELEQEEGGRGPASAGAGRWPAATRQAGVVQPSAPTRRAVRRIFLDPGPAPPRRFERLWGPYPLSGRWWRGEQPRDYYFAETREGEILWLYAEGPGGRWRQIGVVE